MLKLFLFGSPQIEIDEQHVDIPRRKALALLIYLAMSHKPLGRDTLATLFYPDNTQQRARAYLRRDLAALNSALSGKWLLADRETIQLKKDDNFWLDVTEFRKLLGNVQSHKHSPADLCDTCLDALTKASALYNADFLSGFTLRDAPEFDDWQFFQAEELRQELTSVLEKVVLALSARQEHERAIPFARRQLSLDTLHEPAHRTLMQLYAAAGQQAAALRQYEECTRLLQEEFGVPPGDETITLYETIKAKRFVTPLPKNAKSETSVENLHLKTTDTTPHFPEIQQVDAAKKIPFIGRDAELNQMVSLLNLATRRQSQIMLIEGESGIGKSRLVEETAGYARQQGIKLLSGKCYEAEQSLPYQVVIHLVGQALDTWPQKALQQVPSASLAEIARLVPEVAQVSQNLPPPSDFQEAQQGRLFRALIQFFGVLANESGLMLVVDDIQWADQITQQFLNYLVHHFESEPVLMVNIYRSEEAATDEALTGMVENWRHQPTVNHLHLDRLTSKEAATLVEQVLQASPQADSLARRLYQETDGHPFFLVSILQSLDEQGLSSKTNGKPQQNGVLQTKQGDVDPLLPEAVRQSVHNRLRHLQKTTKSVIDLAAVYGRHFDFQTLQAITKTEQNELVDILEDLVARQLWREANSGRAYDFCHDKIREVVYDELSSIRRVMMHRQVAEAIDQMSAGQRVGLLAEHFEKGEVWDRAVSCLTQSAEQATQLFAVGEAVSFYNRAIKIIEAYPDTVDDSTRYRLYEQRGIARMHAGKLAGGISDLERVLRHAEQTGDTTRQRELLIEVGHACRKADRLEQAIDSLTRALGLARHAGDESAEADILYHLGTISFSAGDMHQASKYHQAAVEICDRLGNVNLVAVQAYHGRGEAYFSSGQVTASLKAYGKSLKMAREIGDKNYEAENLQMIGFSYSGIAGAANYELALKFFAESISMSKKLGLDWLTWASMTGWAAATGFSGDYGQALEQIEQHIANLQQVQVAPRYLSFAYDVYGDLLRDLNLIEQAEAAHSRGLEIATDVQIHFWYPRLLANQAIDRIRRGTFDVEDDLLAALTETAKSGAVFHEIRCLEGLAELYLSIGSNKAALEYADYLLAAATLGGAYELTAQAHRWRGEAFVALEDFDAAETALQDAMKLEQNIGRPRLAWDIHRALARLCRQIGNEADAQKHEAQVKQIVGELAANLPREEWRSGLPL